MKKTIAGIVAVILMLGAGLIFLILPHHIISIVMPLKIFSSTFLYILAAICIFISFDFFSLFSPTDGFLPSYPYPIFFKFTIPLISFFIVLVSFEKINDYVSLFRYSGEQTVLVQTTLEKRIGRLLSTLSEPDKLTLDEIKSVVKETQIVLKQLRMETGEKTETLVSIKKELEKARKSGLTEEQYKTIKDALGRSSRGRGVRW